LVAAIGAGPRPCPVAGNVIVNPAAPAINASRKARRVRGSVMGASIALLSHVRTRYSCAEYRSYLLTRSLADFSYIHADGFLSLPPDGIFDIGVTELSTAINPATGA
jgi:hypothetical protein